jgi:hypothetical protein
MQSSGEKKNKGISPVTKSPPQKPPLRQRRLLHAVALLESLDPASRIHKLLLAGKEGVTCRADLRRDFRPGGTGLEGVAAQTLHRHVGVFGMDAFFHHSSSLLNIRAVVPDQSKDLIYHPAQVFSRIFYPSPDRT